MSRSLNTAASYFFLAATRRGSRKGGVRVATNERALAESLRKDKLLLLRAWRLPGWLASQDKVFPLKVQAAFNEILAQLLTRGVPLLEALEVTSQALPPAFSQRVDRIRELVSAGTSFADACEKEQIVDSITSSVYRAAERTGDLGGAASQLTRTSRRQLAIREKAATVMTYPAIVTTISLLVGAAMLVFVVPMIGNQITKAAGPEKIPAFTKVVVGLGNFLRGNMIPSLIAVTAIIGVAILFRRPIGAALSNVLRRLPAMKELLIAQESARFFSVMGAMTRSGVTLADALGTATAAITHPAMQRQLGTLRTRLIEGGSLPTLIESVETLPLPTRRLLVAAERSGEMETAFETLAQDMAAEVEKRSERLLAVLEPALIVMMFLFIGSLILAVMIPMLTVAGSVG